MSYMTWQVIGTALAVLAVALFALYGRKLAGPWRATYVVTAIIALFLNCFVAVAQSFGKFAFLNKQQDDLVAARQQLLDMIKKINATTTEMFRETFDKVNDNFGEMFKSLFGGGSAKLVLVDETDVLESGIEIIARPPGKKLQTISLLSGGERSLTAVAMLVAISRENADIEVVSHEATHQMAGNTGLMPRNVITPTWVAEGIATINGSSVSFETLTASFVDGDALTFRIEAAPPAVSAKSESTGPKKPSLKDRLNFD